MDIPKFKELGEKRAKRLNLGKYHIFWSSKYQEWIFSSSGVEALLGIIEIAAFCIDQDKRWTPIDP